jgi:hypothetical protein
VPRIHVTGGSAGDLRRRRTELRTAIDERLVAIVRLASGVVVKTDVSSRGAIQAPRLTSGALSDPDAADN